MQVTSIFHVAIKTKRASATKRFFIDILGMTEAPRPPFEFPGFWLQMTTPYGTALFHIYTGSAALGANGQVPTGSGAIDHVALTAFGFEGFRQKLRAFDVPYRERGVPGTPLWQLFIYDPNGIQFELNFHSQAEMASGATIDPDNFPQAGLEWFEPSAYDRFDLEHATA